MREWGKKTLLSANGSAAVHWYLEQDFGCPQRQRWSLAWQWQNKQCSHHYSLAMCIPVIQHGIVKSVATSGIEPWQGRGNNLVESTRRVAGSAGSPTSYPVRQSPIFTPRQVLGRPCSGWIVCLCSSGPACCTAILASSSLRSRV